jgi:hypothetical protein
MWPLRLLLYKQSYALFGISSDDESSQHWGKKAITGVSKF